MLLLSWSEENEKFQIFSKFFGKNMMQVLESQVLVEPLTFGVFMQENVNEIKIKGK